VLGAAHQFPMEQVLVWAGVGLAIVVGAGIVVLCYRRKLLGGDRAADAAGLLDDLREMRDRGEISDEEFSAAKQTMAARLTGQMGVAGVKPHERKMKSAGDLVARPGFDLTGAKLPEPPSPDKPKTPPGV